MTDKTQKTIYTGAGGYQEEIDAADKVFVKGDEYTITEGTVHQCVSYCKIEGIDGMWNTALFHRVNINKPPFKSYYERYIGIVPQQTQEGC